MRLIIVRHGETDWNRLRKTQGMTDIGLTQRGLKQARRMGARVRNMQIRCVFSSPLSRAVSTANAIASIVRAPVATDHDLREIAFGEWEGLTFDEIGERYPEELKVWNTDPHLCAPPGKAETLMQVAERCTHFLSRIRKDYEGQTVAAVSHSVPCKAMVALSIGLPLSRIHSLRMDNASMSIIDFYQDRAVLRLFNDTTHLMEELPWQRR
ncbi:MAG: histidine phosphatase family protein [Christensenellales bacterium]